MTEPKAILRCPDCLGTTYIFKRKEQENRTGYMTFIKCKCGSGYIEYLD